MNTVVAVMGVGVVDEDHPILVADDFGLTRGDGCFDATRVVVDERGTHVDYLERHLDRFARSAAGLEIPVDRAAWQELVASAVAAWTTPGEATLKLLLTRGREYAPQGPTGVVTVSPLPETQITQRHGLTVSLLSRGYTKEAFRDASWLLGGVKTTSYAVNMAAKREAGRRGADDVVFTTADGWALEGPNAALVWAEAGALCTTTLEHTGVLESITQTVAFERAAAAGVETRSALIRAKHLFDADGVWLLSSIRGVAPVTAIDGRAVTVDRELTRRLNEWTGFSAPS